MWKKPSLAHPSTWFCLLGSTLALVAFFLPYYVIPPESSLPSASLADCLASCAALDNLFFQQSAAFGVVTVGAGALLVLLLYNATLAVLSLLLRAPRWKMTERLLWCSGMTLVGYLFISFLTYTAALVDIEIASRSNEDPTQETQRLIGIGSWLIPTGLALALIGGILLAHKNRGQVGKSE